MLESVRIGDYKHPLAQSPQPAQTQKDEWFPNGLPAEAGLEHTDQQATSAQCVHAESALELVGFREPVGLEGCVG